MESSSSSSSLACFTEADDAAYLDEIQRHFASHGVTYQHVWRASVECVVQQRVVSMEAGKQSENGTERLPCGDPGGCQDENEFFILLTIFWGGPSRVARSASVSLQVNLRQPPAPNT
eukprot:5962725-Pyramimonas_sp.AAC.1